ncbi:MAG: hypothetical protein KF724_04155 [Phycisphaeraceae bacterium]|nr:hypothetical protein [Phycisphaeraceae bacterium]
MTVRGYRQIENLAAHSLKHAKTIERGSGLECVTTALFSAFMFEGYLNHVGPLKIRHWEHFERLPWRSKTEILLSDLGLPCNWGEGELQVIAAPFKLRDGLAHSRTETQVLEYTDDGSPGAGRGAMIPSYMREWNELKGAERALDAVRKTCTNIHEVAGLGEWDMEPLADGFASG